MKVQKYNIKTENLLITAAFVIFTTIWITGLWVAGQWAWEYLRSVGRFYAGIFMWALG